MRHKVIIPIVVIEVFFGVAICTPCLVYGRNFDVISADVVLNLQRLFSDRRVDENSTIREKMRKLLFSRTYL